MSEPLFVPPTHLLDVAGADKTKCGISMRRDEALPVVLAEHAPMHVAGRDMQICPACGESVR
jgi:hypothetical protein